VIFALVVFVVGGSARLDAVSIGLSAILGLAFGGAMYAAGREPT
jgi:hypothetical protein